MSDEDEAAFGASPFLITFLSDFKPDSSTAALLAETLASADSADADEEFSAETFLFGCVDDKPSLAEPLRTDEWSSGIFVVDKPLFADSLAAGKWVSDMFVVDTLLLPETLEVDNFTGDVFAEDNLADNFRFADEWEADVLTTDTFDAGTAADHFRFAGPCKSDTSTERTFVAVCVTERIGVSFSCPLDAGRVTAGMTAADKLFSADLSGTDESAEDASTAGTSFFENSTAADLSILSGVPEDTPSTDKLTGRAVAVVVRVAVVVGIRSPGGGGTGLVAVGGRPDTASELMRCEPCRSG